MIARRTWLALGAGTLCLIGIALAVPWPLYDAALQDRISTQIQAIAGLETEVRLPPQLSLFPRPSISLRGLVIRTANNALRIEAPQATAAVRIFSLLDGQFELSSLALSQPTLFVDLDAAPPTAGAISRAADAPRESPEAASADVARLGGVTIESGLASVRSRSSGFETLIEDIQAVLSWPRIGAPASLLGHATWRGMSGALSAHVDQPSALLRGDMSGAALRFTSAAGTFSFDGSIVGGKNPQMSGRLQATVPSLEHLMNALHVEMPLAGAVQSLSVAGDVRASRRELSLTGVNLMTDGNAFEGSLALGRSAGRLHLSGTLATDLLTIDPLVSGLDSRVPPPDTSVQQDAQAPDVARWTTRLANDLSRGDIDLRVSASAVRLAQMRFTDAAISLLSSNGRVDVSLAEARGYRGMVKAKALIGTGAGGLDVRTSASFADGDIGALLSDALGVSRLIGSGSLAFSLETNGASLGQLQENLDGHGQIGLGPGEVDGIDIEQVLRRVERKTVRAAELENRSGRTAFDTARASFVVSKGVLTIDDAVVSGPGMAMTLAGTVSTVDGSGKLKAVAVRVDASDPIKLAIEITGPWNHPSIRPDFASVLHEPLVHFSPSDQAAQPDSNE
jgi:AsmA protein